MEPRRALVVCLKNSKFFYYLAFCGAKWHKVAPGEAKWLSVTLGVMSGHVRTWDHEGLTERGLNGKKLLFLSGLAIWLDLSLIGRVGGLLSLIDLRLGGWGGEWAGGKEKGAG